MKKFFYLLFVLVFSVSLFACDDADSSSAGKDAGDEKPAEKEDKDKSDKGKEKEETINDLYAEYAAHLMPVITDDQIELTQESYDFFVENHSIFPAKTDNDIEQAKKLYEAVELKKLNKSISQYYSTVTGYEGEVIQIEEEVIEDSDGDILTYANIADDNDNNHTVIMIKSAEDIYEGDQVRFIGTPVGVFNYETLDGGSQNSVIFYGSHIEKK